MVALLVLVALAGSVFAADSTLVVKAEVRVRGEADGRDFESRTPLLGYSLLRTRLGVEMRPSANVTGFIQIQDSRRMGGELVPAPGAMTSQPHFLDLHQGYLQLDKFLAEALSVRIGRMEMSYGSQRVVGADEWNNIGRAFDGLLFRYSSGGHTVDLFASNVVSTVVPPEPVSPSSVRQSPDVGFLFSGLWYELTEISSVRLAGYLFHEWDKLQDQLSRGTIGFFADGSLGDLLYNGEVAYQGGQRYNTGVSAFMVVGSLGCTLGENRRAFVRAGYQYFSGTEPGDLTDRTFEPVFHTAHDLAGGMDYFSNPASSTSRRGLQDIFLSVRPMHGEEFSMTVAFHHFLLSKPWSGERGLGEELDVSGRYSAWNSAALEFGISAFSPNDVMKSWYNSTGLGLWGYLAVRMWFPSTSF